MISKMILKSKTENNKKLKKDLQIEIRKKISDNKNVNNEDYDNKYSNNKILKNFISSVIFISFLFVAF